VRLSGLRLECLEEAGADAIRDAVEIDQGEKIDGAERRVETFSQFAIEDLVAEALAGGEVVYILREGETEERSGSIEALAVLG